MSADMMHRLVKCPGWKWVRGLLMRTPEGDVCDVSYVAESGTPVHEAFTEDDGWVKTVGGIPVATDPLLPGWVLRLVREATDDPGAHVVLCEGRWFVVNGKMRAQVFRMCDTEIEALVLALEAAPVKS